MHLSTTHYRRAVLAYGILMILYGGGGVVTYSILALTGVNNLSNFTNGMGVLFLGLMGAFALPLGIALLRKGDHSRVLLVITAAAMLINALIRVSILLIPNMNAQVGTATPIAEFFIFGSLGILAYLIRPKGQ